MIEQQCPMCGHHFAATEDDTECPACAGLLEAELMDASSDPYAQPENIRELEFDV